MLWYSLARLLEQANQNCKAMCARETDPTLQKQRLQSFLRRLLSLKAEVFSIDAILFYASLNQVTVRSLEPRGSSAGKRSGGINDPPLAQSRLENKRRRTCVSFEILGSRNDHIYRLCQAQQILVDRLR